MKKCIDLNLSDVFIILINVKMPTIVGILTLMSRINFMLKLSIGSATLIKTALMASLRLTGGTVLHP